MTCDQVRPLLNAYLDDELDLSTLLSIEKHLSDCPACRQEFRALQAAGRAVGQTATYHPAPADLRDRIQASMRKHAAKADVPSGAFATLRRRKILSLYGIAAAVLVFIGSAILLLPSHTAPPLIADLVDSHVRSLQENHLLDVESTDQHTVKPWFAGKLNFSPPVIDLSAEGFPLVGGRLDYLDQRQVAALVYRHRKHVINLFIWPMDGSQTNASPQVDSKLGFNLVRFDSKGMTCWAVSDLNTAELQNFADLFAAQHSASTRN